jgi:DNA-binding beta-propeller fold protein YncE
MLRRTSSMARSFPAPAIAGGHAGIDCVLHAAIAKTDIQGGEQTMRKLFIRFAVTLAALPAVAAAQVVGFALEPKVILVDGMPKIVQSPAPDYAVFFEFSGATAKKLGQVAVPTNFYGPPSSVSVSADRTLALVSTSQRIDPKDPAKFAPDNRLSVIDLSASPLRVVQTLELGASPASIAMNPAGTMALAMNTNDDSVTILSIAGKQATIVEKLPIGKGSGPLAAAFNPDGRTVLVTRGGDHKVSLYAVEGNRLNPKPLRDMIAGVRPFGVSYCGSTGLAVVSNMGANGDADTVSLLDMTAAPPRVVDTATVGPAPEGVACAPDGRHAATAIQNMSNRPPQNPFYSPNSKVVLLKIEGKRLHRVAEAPIGAWSQGVAFLDDSRTLIAETIVDRSVHLLRIDGDTLKVAAPPMVFTEGGPVAHGIAGR